MTLLFFIMSKMAQRFIKFNGGKSLSLMHCLMSHNQMKTVYLYLELMGEGAYEFSLRITQKYL